MDVRCEKCDTTYEFDESRVTEAGVNVKCSQCGNLFRVRRRPPFVTREMPGLRGAAAQLQQAGSREAPAASVQRERFWQLRLRYTQEVLRFRDLTTLRKWILDKRVTRDDDISRAGKAWRRLGSIVELESLFHVVEQAEIARLRTGKTGRVTVSAQSPPRGAPLAQEPQRLRTGTPGLGVGPPLVSLPPRVPIPVRPDFRAEEGAPAAAMGLSSTGRTMRPRLQVRTDLQDAVPGPERIAVRPPPPMALSQGGPMAAGEAEPKGTAPLPAVTDPAAPRAVTDRPSGAVPRHIVATPGLEHRHVVPPLTPMPTPVARPSRRQAAPPQQTGGALAPAPPRPITFDVSRAVQLPKASPPAATHTDPSLTSPLSAAATVPFQRVRAPSPPSGWVPAPPAALPGITGPAPRGRQPPPLPVVSLQDEKDAWLSAAEPVLTALSDERSDRPLPPLRPQPEPEPIPSGLKGQPVITSVRADPTPAAVITLVSDDPSHPPRTPTPEPLPPPAPLPLPEVRLPTPPTTPAPQAAAPQLPEPAQDTAPPPRPSFPEIEEAILRSDPVPRHLQQALHAEAPVDPEGPPREGPRETEFIDEPVPLLRRAGGGVLLAGVAVALLTFAGVYVYLGSREAGTPADRVAAGGRGAAAYAEGRRLFLRDTDEDFQLAHDQLLRAVGADERAPRPLALLAELHATWAHYLRDDAAAATPALAARLRQEAQLQIDNARRYAGQAEVLDAADHDVNRARAELLLLSGANATQVEQALERAAQNAPPDADLLYVHALLELREGRIDNARAVLVQAAGAGQPAPLRVLLLLGQIQAAAGNTEAARKLFTQMLERNPSHRRAREALAALDRQDQAAPDGGPSAKADATQVVPSPAPAPAAEDVPAHEGPRDFRRLLAQAQRLLDTDRPRDAQRLYQKLLPQHRDAPEVHIGLGACALDTEHFMEAIGHYKDALSQQPNSPEAIIGLAEAYKLHGDRALAVEWYRAYLDKYPGGSSARLARNNIERLSLPRPPTGQEPGTPAPEAPAAPQDGTKPPPAP